tara:strand:- start:106 stop:462 length:357 start_codon:yes stop_codon:yes gene_type:complete
MTLFINFKIENITRNKNYEVCNKRDSNGKTIDFSNNYNGKNLLKDKYNYFVTMQYRFENTNDYKPYSEIPVKKDCLYEELLLTTKKLNETHGKLSVSVCDLVNNTETMITNQNLQVAQ